MTIDEKWCGYCAYAAEHVNDPNSPCYSCDRHKSSFKPANVIENIENRLVARAEKAEAEVAKLTKIDGLEIVMTKQMQKMIDTELKKRFEELKPKLATRYEELLNMRNNELAEWKQVASMLADALCDANSERFPVSWEDASESDPAWIAYVNLRDRSKE